MFEAQHALDDSGEMIHNATMLAGLQDDRSEYHSSKGRERFIAKTRVPMLYEANSGDDGFVVGNFYQYKAMDNVDDGDIMAALERVSRYKQDYITVTTGYCQILEIRKRVGKQIQIRGSMKRTDASKGEALVAALQPSGTSVSGFQREQAVLIQAPIPLTEFGCEVTFKADDTSGALILQPIRRNQEQHQIQEFTINLNDILCESNMEVECAKVTIMDMTVRELNAELKARELCVSGNKRDKLYRLLSSMLATRSQSDDEQ